MNTDEYVFIDESGDPSLETEKDGVSEFYVVGAVLISGKKDLDLCRKKTIEIQTNHFNKNEIKSSSVGKNIERRRKILCFLNKLNLKFYAFIVDKKNIYKDSGLQFKKSFIKYIHGRLYKRIYKSFCNLHIVADEHGHPEFMASFKKYLKKKYPQTLFDHNDFSFGKSVDEPLLQVVDFFTGSVQRVYSKKDPPDVLNEFSKITIMLEKWPPSSENINFMEGIDTEEKYDQIIALQGIIQARSFVDAAIYLNDEELDAQVETIQYLLYKWELNPYVYVSTKEIIEFLNEKREIELTEHRFRSHVIAKLRNFGVIIASGTNGYKLPNCSKDIETFVALVNNQTIPYLKRLSVARRQLLLATKGGYEIISEYKFPELLKCINAIDEKNFDTVD